MINVCLLLWLSSDRLHQEVLSHIDSVKARFENERLCCQASKHSMYMDDSLLYLDEEQNYRANINEKSLMKTFSSIENKRTDRAHAIPVYILLSSIVCPLLQRYKEELIWRKTQLESKQYFLNILQILFVKRKRSSEALMLHCLNHTEEVILSRKTRKLENFHEKLRSISFHLAHVCLPSYQASQLVFDNALKDRIERYWSQRRICLSFQQSKPASSSWKIFCVIYLAMTLFSFNIRLLLRHQNQSRCLELLD